jgi:hypothetical protein
LAHNFPDHRGAGAARPAQAPRKPRASPVQSHASLARTGDRLKRSFCFNMPPNPLSSLDFIATHFFELVILDGFVN